MSIEKYSAGDTWGQLTLVSDIFGGDDYRSTKKSIFKCSCGLNHFATLNNVTRGIVTHCLACSSKKKSSYKKTHGHSMSFKDRDPIGYKCYYTWQAIKRRCNNKQDSAYDRYGGRGIKVCDRWTDSYQNFLDDIGPPPSADHQIDRADNDGNYEPENCKWVTREENARNKRNSRNLVAFGKKQTLQAWANEIGVKRETIARRLNSGAGPEDALSKVMKRPGKVRRVSTPSGIYETLSEAAHGNGMSISGMHSRVKSPNFTEWFYTDDVIL
jgi:ribosomal protein S16